MTLPTVFSFKFVEAKVTFVAESFKSQFKSSTKRLSIKFSEAPESIKTFTGTKDVKLLLDKNAEHRLSETHQLQNITDIIQEIKTKL